MCKKLQLFDKILLVTPDAYIRSALVLSVEILAVLCVAGVKHAIEMHDCHLGSIMTLVIVGWKLVSCASKTVILQFLNCLGIIRNRFNKLRTQLPAMIVREFEEEIIQTFL